MSNSDWIAKKIAEMPKADRLELTGELLLELSNSPKTQAESMGLVLMSDYTEAAKQLHASFGKMQGLSSGYAKIDQLTKGLVGGEMIIVAGKTSRGKTTLALNIANNVALGGKSVLFVTLEMTHEEITSRTMYINGGDTEDYYAASALIAFQKVDELDWKSIDKLIEKAKVDLDVSLVVIDHLHYFTRELANVAEDLGRITKEFKKNAIRHKVPIMLISHVRKTGRGEEASMEDLRGSSYMAQDADVVLMVGKIQDRPDVTLVKIEKNRNRGFDYENDTVELYTDKIKMYDSAPTPVDDVIRVTGW